MSNRIKQFKQRGSILITTLLMTALMSLLLNSLLEQSIMEIRLHNAIAKRIAYFDAIQQQLKSVSINPEQYRHCSQVLPCKYHKNKLVFSYYIKTSIIEPCLGIKKQSLMKNSLLTTVILNLPDYAQTYEAVIATANNSNLLCSKEKILINQGVQSIFLR